MFALAAVLCLALAGCEYDDAEVKDRLDDLEGRVDALEKTVNSLNINVGNLQSLIDGKLFITAVTENPEGGGYTLSLVTSDGEASQIVIKDGEAGAAPAIGVKLDSDGKYYWTLDGEFITEGGKKMPVTGDDGVTPVFKIENDTWYVSYDKEATWKECGPATGAAGDSFFSDVSTSEDGRWVYLTLADGETVLTLEMYKEFGIAFESLPELIMAGATAEIPFVLTGADEKSVVEAIAKGDWEAEAVMDGTEGGKIVVTAPAESSTGRVIVLLSDGESKTIMKTLTFVSGVMNVTTQSQEAAAVGGTVSFELETDLDYEVVIPDDAKEWLSRVETRALRQETLTFSAKANETMEERQAKIELISSGVVVETLLVYQKANLDPTAFVVKVNVTESSMKNTLILPLTGTVDATVDWGDGKTETVTAVNPQHVYEQEGEYYVTVTGSVTALGNRLTKTSQSAIVRVIQWGQLGLESLAVRMKRHCDNALAVARFLKSRDEVAWVRYAGLEDDNDHALAQKYCPQGTCGVLAFALKGSREKAEKFMDSLQLAIIATHVADARTCLLHPASHTHRQLSDEQLKEAGVDKDLIRFSIGLEDPQDIIDDIRQALIASEA